MVLGKLATKQRTTIGRPSSDGPQTHGNPRIPPTTHAHPHAHHPATQHSMGSWECLRLLGKVRSRSAAKSMGSTGWWVWADWAGFSIAPSTTQGGSRSGQQGKQLSWSAPFDTMAFLGAGRSLRYQGAAHTDPAASGTRYSTALAD